MEFDDIHSDQILRVSTPPPINALRRKPTPYLRALVLLLASFITIGSYYVYDTPSSLYAALQDHYLFYNESSGSAATFELYFNLLYSLYSIPNILLPFLGGHLVDTVGMRVCIVLFSLLVLTGQIITALGVTIHSMSTMLLGRLIFGLGGECLVVGQSAFISAWFHGREVAFALGFTLSVSRVGSVANDWGSPRIAQEYGVVAAFWFGAFLCLCSTGTAFLLACIDQGHRGGGRLEEEEDAERRVLAAAGGGSVGGRHFDFKPVTASHAEDLARLAPSSWVHSGSYFETPHPSTYGVPRSTSHGSSHSHSGGGTQQGGGHPHHHPANPLAGGTTTTIIHGTQEHHEALQARLARLAQLDAAVEPISEDSLWHLLGFDTMFWLLATVCLLSYGAIMPFNNMAQGYLLKYYLPITVPAPDGVDCSFRPVLPEWQDYCDAVDQARRRAGSLQSVPFIVAGLLTPLIGIVIDRFGHRTLYILMGPVLLLATHFVFLMGGTSALVPLCGLGLAYSIIAAVVWPSVPLAVHDTESSRRSGTAFGILTVFQNLSMAVFPMAIAALFEVSHDYVLSEYFFILVSLAGIVTSVALMVEDERHGAVLRRYVVDGDGHYHPSYPEHHWGRGGPTSKDHEAAGAAAAALGEAAPLVGGGAHHRAYSEF